MGLYAVAQGRQPGIYATWEAAERQIAGFSGAKFKKFAGRAEAERYVAQYGSKAKGAGSATQAPSVLLESDHQGHRSFDAYLSQQQLPLSHQQQQPQIAKRHRAAGSTELLYAVAVGRQAGVYTSWSECEAQVVGFSGAKHKKCATREEADAYISEHKGCSDGGGDCAAVNAKDTGGPSYDAHGCNSTSSSGFVRGLSSTDCHRDDSHAGGCALTHGRGVAVRVYTDGSCLRNPGRGGWAYVVAAGKWECGADPATTNQRMEVTAAFKAVDAHLNKELHLHSDSKYVVDCFNEEWWVGWKRRGWMTARGGKPVMNQDLWRPFIELVKHRREHGQAIVFHYVPAAHDQKSGEGDPMNHNADRIAACAAERQRGARGKCFSTLSMALAVI